MFKKNELLNKLEVLRELIIDDNMLNDKRVTVCTDSALLEIVNKMPLKSSDFLAISGLEKNFIENYSSMFLKVISDYRLESNKEVNVSKSAKQVLHHYKDRLTNISKTNRNLYMGKIENVRSFDLFNLNDEEGLFNFLSNVKVKSLKLNLNSLEANNITTLYRSTNKVLRETGSYNLYIAYPFVEGIFKKEKFPIKAPLLYFPVQLTRNKREFTIKKDLNKDIILNRDLLLLSSKIESNNLDANMPNITSLNKDSFKEVIEYYEKNDFKIINKEYNISFTKFVNELKEEFSQRSFSDFTLRPFITLGRYEPYSSMIQKDMNTILTSSKYNELLEGLIDEGDLYSNEKVYAVSKDNYIVKESRLAYINDLNDAQEKVLDLLNDEKRIVIWGPPGTGKSQTITSLIASSVLRGENVLVVSEKKVALDVIYSRLKGAAKYTMFIDDAQNKQEFYNKLKTYIDPMPPVRTRNNDIYELEQEIIEITKKLDKSLKLLYGKNDEDISVIDIYEKYLKDKDILEDLTPLKIYHMYERHFKNLTFKQLSLIEDKFDKNKSLEEYLLFQKKLNDYPILLKLNSKITRSAKIEIENFDKDYKEFKSKYITLGYFSKRKLKKEFINNNKMRLSFLTNKASLDKKYLNLIVKDEEFNNFIVEYSTKLDKFITKHNALSSNDKKFLDMLLYDELLSNVEDVTKLRKYLIAAYYTGYIESFKTLNQENLYIVEDYIKNIDRVKELMNEKMNVTTETFEMTLYRHALNFSNTRRIMDIKRIIDSPQRPSINAFIDTYHPEMMENVKVWMMTPEVVSAVVPLLYGMFDLVIFDEASQMYVEKGIPAIYRAKKVVIAGDPKQLRPSSLGFGRVSENDDLYEDETIKDVSLDAKSLLDLARYKYKEILLNYHYRSKYEELIAFSNHAFYDGKLIVSPNQSQSDKPPIEYVYVEDGLFIDRRNKEEALQVVETIKKILRQRKNNESIGVITFNSSQRDLIESYIDKELFSKSANQQRLEKELNRTDDGEDTSLFIKNIENVQGDERDIIIFSMGYAKDKFGKVNRRFGWLNHEGGQNRLNVAITRAKKKIYFVSSLYPDELHVEDLTNDGPLLLKNFMKYCYYVSDNKPELAKGILRSLKESNEDLSEDNSINSLVEEVKLRLERNNYDVKTSIGIGNYSIDLAIYNKDTKSYELGIICDISNSDSKQSRTELLHQEKYLASRNWNVYRLFSSNWYTDPNQEMRNIRDLLKNKR